MLNEVSKILPRSEKSRPTPARCPVCGMLMSTPWGQINEKTVKIVEYQGKAYVVASEDCKTRFLASPEKYVGRTVDLSSASQRSHYGGGHGCC